MEVIVLESKKKTVAQFLNLNCSGESCMITHHVISEAYEVVLPLSMAENTLGIGHISEAVTV